MTAQQASGDPEMTPTACELARSGRARGLLPDDRVVRLTATEAERLEAALEAEPRVIPELAALIRGVKGQKTETAAAADPTA